MSTGLGNIMERQKAMIHSLFYLLLKNDFCQLQGPSRHTERLVSNVSKTETWKMKRDKPSEMLNKRKKSGLQMTITLQSSIQMQASEVI